MQHCTSGKIESSIILFALGDFVAIYLSDRVYVKCCFNEGNSHDSSISLCAGGGFSIGGYVNLINGCLRILIQIILCYFKNLLEMQHKNFDKRERKIYLLQKEDTSSSFAL